MPFIDSLLSLSVVGVWLLAEREKIAFISMVSQLRWLYSNAMFSFLHAVRIGIVTRRYTILDSPDNVIIIYECLSLY